MVIVFKAENIGFHVQFNESATAYEIVNKLPLEGTVKKWGDEIYFQTGLDVHLDKKTMNVNIGDVAYWPEGKAICIFYGRTLASVSDKPVPASPVVVIGHTFAPGAELKEIKVGEKISAFIVGRNIFSSNGRNPYQDDRKLTQEEIDELVRKLLDEKKLR